MDAAQNALLLEVRPPPIVIVDDEKSAVLAGLLDPELALEPHPAIPAMRAAAARPATAVTPKRLRSTIGPPVSTSSGTRLPTTPPLPAIRVVRAWKIDPMYRDVNGQPRPLPVPSPK